MDVPGGECKVQCCKKQYCIGTWNVTSINQGKLDVVKWEMTKASINILGISELKWTGEFNLGDHYIYYYGQESYRRNGVPTPHNLQKSPNAVFGCNPKNDKMISVHFQGKPISS